MRTMVFMLTSGWLCATALSAGSKDAFTDTFAVDKADLASVGTNRFFVLVPGFQAVLVGKEGGQQAVLTLTVLPETKRVSGREYKLYAPGIGLIYDGGLKLTKYGQGSQ